MRVWIALIALLFLVGAGSAQTSRPDRSRAERMAALIEWVKTEGRSSFLDEPAARLLRLGDAVQPVAGGAAGTRGLPVQRKAYIDDDTKDIYVVALGKVSGREVHVLYRTTATPATSTLWRISDAGAIEVTGLVTRSGFSNPHDPDIAALEETLSYLESCKSDLPPCGPIHK